MAGIVVSDLIFRVACVLFEACSLLSAVPYFCLVCLFVDYCLVEGSLCLVFSFLWHGSL